MNLEQLERIYVKLKEIEEIVSEDTTAAMNVFACLDQIKAVVRREIDAKVTGVYWKTKIA